MKYEDIKTMLGATSMSATYYEWPIGHVPDLPYLVWYLPGSQNFTADDKVYQKIDTLNVELYTEEKDFTTEAIVEGVLNANYMAWDKVETYIESERMYQVLYTMEVVING